MEDEGVFCDYIKEITNDRRYLGQIGEDIMDYEFFRLFRCANLCFRRMIDSNKNQEHAIAYCQYGKFFLHLAFYHMSCKLTIQKYDTAWLNACVFDSLKAKGNFGSYVKKIRYLTYAWDVDENRSSFLDKLQRETNEIGKMFNLETDIRPNIGYNSQFQEMFLPKWKEEIPNDFEYAFKPVRISNFDEKAEKFRAEARELLKFSPINVKEPSDFEMASWISDSSNYCETGNLRKELRRGVTPELTSKWHFKRNPVLVSPGNYRDCWMASLDTWFTLKYYSNILRQIIQPWKSVLITTEANVVARLQPLKSTKNVYYEVDWKKQGIAQVKEWLYELCDVLTEKYPNINWELLKSGMKSITVLDLDGVEKNPIRGLGLGHLLELVTFMHVILCRHIGLKHRVVIDDVILWEEYTNNLTHKKTLARIRATYNEFGVHLSESKVIVSRAARICERYFNTSYYGVDYSKSSLIFTPLANALCGGSIAYAKLYLKAMYDIYCLTGIDIVYRKVRNLFVRVLGFEVSEKELILPTNLGGWNFITVSSYDQTLRDIVNLPEVLKSKYGKLDEDEIATLRCSFTPIRCKKEIENPFLKDKNYFFNSDSSWVNSIIQPMIKEKLQTLKNAYNVKGLHNAKPHMIYGQAMKMTKKRYRLLRKLLDDSCDETRGVDEDELIETLLYKLRNIGIKNIAMPKVNKRYTDMVDISAGMTKLRLALTPFMGVRDEYIKDQWKIPLAYFVHNVKGCTTNIPVGPAPDLTEAELLNFGGVTNLRCLGGLVRDPWFDAVTRREKFFLSMFSANAELCAAEYCSVYRERPKTFIFLDHLIPNEEFPLMKDLLLDLLPRVSLKNGGTQYEKLRIPMDGRSFLINEPGLSKLNNFFKYVERHIQVLGKDEKLKKPYLAFIEDLYRIKIHDFNKLSGVIDKFIRVMKVLVERSPPEDPGEGIEREIYQPTYEFLEATDVPLPREWDIEELIEKDSIIDEDEANMQDFIDEMGFDDNFDNYEEFKPPSIPDWDEDMQETFEVDDPDIESQHGDRPEHFGSFSFTLLQNLINRGIVEFDTPEKVAQLPK
jgi:hypothetical protein